MKQEQLKEMLSTNGIELNENVNIEAIAKGINDAFNPIIESKVSKATKGLMSQEDFIKGQGFENIDSYNAFIKNTKATATELTEAKTRLDGEVKTLSEQLADAQAKVKGYEFDNKLRDAGVNADIMDYAKFKLNGMITEEVDFDSALKTLRETDKMFSNEETGFKVGKETKNDNKPTDKKAGFELYKEMKAKGRL